jgi:hypothetical protein
MANETKPPSETKIALLHSFSPARTLDGLSSDRQSLAGSVVTPSSCHVVLLWCSMTVIASLFSRPRSFSSAVMSTPSQTFLRRAKLYRMKNHLQLETRSFDRPSPTPPRGMSKWTRAEL